MTTFLKSQAKDGLKQSVFFSNIRRYRLQQINVNKNNYRWGEPDYKIYPSALEFDMCPAQYIKSLEEWGGIKQLDAIYKVSRGSAVHRELQNDFLSHGLSYAIHPDYVADSRIHNKNDNNRPEVAFHCLESGISGSADAVLEHKKRPVVIEIKTTNIVKEKWGEHKEKNLPLKKHVCQICVYMHMFNKYQYFDKPVEKGIIAYLNLLMMPGDQEAEKEVHIDFAQYQQTTADLIENLTKVRQEYINKTELKCTYKHCREHSS